MTPTEGQSVLTMMRKGVEDIAKKKEKAAGLAPTATEASLIPRPALPDVPGDFLTPEGLRDKAASLREYAAYLIKVADGLDAITGLATKFVTPEDMRAEVKAAEAAADAKHAARSTDFAEQYRQQQEVAQAAVFDKAPADAQVNDGQAAIGWVCPTHGAAVQKTSPKGRVYTGCPTPGCRELER